jgi:hypothetical protein
MPEQLNKADYEYILSCLKHARYAYEEGTSYPTHELKRQRLANLGYMEGKLQALRDAINE